MPFKQSIAAKIFGLAVFLLLLTVVLTGFLLHEVAHTERDLEVVAHLDVPLTESVSRIHEYGLRRRLAFERLYGALDSTHMNAGIISEATTNYTEFTGKVMFEIKRARDLLSLYPKQNETRASLVDVRRLLDQLEATYPTVSSRQQEILELQRQKNFAQADQMIGILNDMQALVQTLREQLQSTMVNLSSGSVRAAASREHQVMGLAIAAAASTVLLGLVVAAIITDRLTRPVRSLVVAMRDVQKGNLEVQLPVKSTDEVGALTDSFNFFVQELRSKEQIKRTFGKYIDPRVLEQVLAEPGVTAVAGGRHMMTVLFADLVGFTNYSERLTPKLMVTVLNRHFGLQAQAVQEYRGVVDKFIGDSVMAFWGAPFVPGDEHPILACQAAIAQLAAVDVLRRELPDLTGLRKEAPAIDLRVGICTGDVVVGNIGSENTRSYTVIGDTVNLSARLEAANRIYGTRILMAEATAEGLAGKFETREIDSIAVKGKTEPTRVFELLGPAEKVSEDTLRLRDVYGKALAAYRAANWDGAETAFRECLAIEPKDAPATLFVKRIEILRRTPPAPGWNGVWLMEEK